MRSRRSPCSPVAASVLCAIAHKTDYVASPVMLRRFATRSFRSARRDSPQHNFRPSQGFQEGHQILVAFPRADWPGVADIAESHGFRFQFEVDLGVDIGGVD